MLSRLSRHVSYANVVSTLSLFIVLGGVAYAGVEALGKNSVNSRAIARNAVKAPDIAPNAVKASETARNSVGTSEVIDGSLGQGDFAPGTLLQGPPGAQGQQGIQGIQGPAGPGARWVLVRGSDGAVLATNDSSITVARDAGGGFYFVNFGSSVLNKLIVATRNRTAGSQTGEIFVGPCGDTGPGANDCAQSDNANTVLVQTTDSAGATLDRNFYLAVIDG
jgi:hypothetical protein